MGACLLFEVSEQKGRLCKFMVEYCKLGSSREQICKHKQKLLIPYKTSSLGGFKKIWYNLNIDINRGRIK
jgi:hypothetical protein